MWKLIVKQMTREPLEAIKAIVTSYLNEGIVKLKNGFPRGIPLCSRIKKKELIDYCIEFVQQTNCLRQFTLVIKSFFSEEAVSTTT